MRLSALCTYPVKGARGLDHNKIIVEPRGLWGDRRWMVVDDRNHFLSQREIAGMAMMAVQHTIDGLEITIPGHETIKISMPDSAVRVNAVVWGDEVSAVTASEKVNRALSEAFGKTVRLVFMDTQAIRTTKSDVAPAGSEVSFADAFPLLVTSQRSLSALNDHIVEEGGQPVPMERFRANLIVDGENPWDEDSWAVLKVGDMIFDVVSPCARCVVTTRDQKTGYTTPDNQPIRTLTRIRMSGDKRETGVLFGWNLVPRGKGVINTGDEVEVLERRERWKIVKKA